MLQIPKPTLSALGTREATSVANLAEAPVLLANDGAVMLDLGAGIAGVFFRSRLKIIGRSVMGLLSEALATVAADYSGLVIGGDGGLFSAGADINLFLAAIGADDLVAIDRLEIEFQALTLALKDAPFPIIACPEGVTYGGGCELSLHAHEWIIAEETRAGLVEAAVGLIPAGGGTKELALRAHAKVEQLFGAQAGDEERLEALSQVLRLLLTARVSGTGGEAVAMGLYDLARTELAEPGTVLWPRAKALAQFRAQHGEGPAVAAWRSEGRRCLRALGEPGLVELQRRAEGLVRELDLGPHDLEIARRLALVLAGGHAKRGELVSEPELLDLERRLFVELAAIPATRRRLEHRLATRQRLKN